MTKDQSQAGILYPPRMAVVKWPLANGYYQAAIKHFPIGDNEVEYLSLQEAEALANRKAAEARNSAKESLEILARAVEVIRCDKIMRVEDGLEDEVEHDHDEYCFRCSAIAQVKARGDWPLDEDGRKG